MPGQKLFIRNKDPGFYMYMDKCGSYIHMQYTLRYSNCVTIIESVLD